MKYVLCLLILASLCVKSYAQDNQGGKNTELYRKIAALDSAFFEAYNTCKLVVMESFMADDLEFYHDQGGVMNKEQVLEATRKNICGKVERELVKESLEVYPISNYGAIETGTHRFKNLANGDTDFGRPAKFLHIWQLKEGKWKIARIISYDH